ncbi:MAG TPA: TolC family protein [Sedimentisphaerales bacterium]|nr:TolC family protein [Sedimentisphaerales bacterium]HNU28637.1 TolC family protein [Sedimentisphaerales bacterium]
MKRSAVGCLVCAVSLSCCSMALIGCRSPAKYREKADTAAYGIIEQKQQESLGKTEPFTIERPSDIIRRRLIEIQALPVSSEASLGTDRLKQIPHWPDENYPLQVSSADASIPIEPNRPVRISLVDALQIAARNSRDYQSRKESIFRVALTLDLRRDAFRTVFRTGADATLARNTVADQTTLDAGASADVGRTLKNGVDLSTALAISLVSLLPGSDSLGWNIDPSVSIPLLRGAGRHIVTESLTQAERNVVYEMWDFERYKRTFAVNIAQRYYSVLRQMDSLTNSENNYRSAIQSARWSRRQADAGRISEIQVDQAAQRELSARNNWISTQQGLKDSLDSFKTTIGLPPDAWIELDPNDLVQLRARSEEYIATMRQASSGPAETVPAADAPVTLVPADDVGAGPYEIDEALAIQLALENRLDLKAANGAVYDAQRQVVVAADALRPELTLGARAAYSGNDSDGTWSLQGTRYSGTASIDLPIDERSRTQERNAYRNSLIALEQATRSVQNLEDEIKQSIRSELRVLLESRETVKIQAKSVLVAEKQVRSTTLFLEAGRSEIRDLLEAQDALLSAQNSLTSAIVNYRTTELQFQRDLDLLTITQEGLWEEFSPEDMKHDSQQQS